jgi:DNA-binding protein HU-beta
MNSNDIADSLATAHGLTKEASKKMVDGVFTAITSAAVNGEEVSIPGFGKFKVKDSPARDGRNPATGAAMKIAASRKLGFTLAKAVKDKLNA